MGTCMSTPGTCIDYDIGGVGKREGGRVQVKVTAGQKVPFDQHAKV